MTEYFLGKRSRFSYAREDAYGTANDAETWSYAPVQSWTAAT